MSSKPTRQKTDRDNDTDDNGSILETPREPPAKRRMTSKSPELEQTSASTDFVSIFGDGGGKDAEVAARGEESGNREGSGSEVAAGAERLPETTVTAEGMREMAVDRLFSERVVTVLVGPSQTTWRLHENLLSSSSDFFRSAFNSGFRESHEDKLYLPEDDPAAFELFVRWLYSRALLHPSSRSSTTASGSYAIAGPSTSIQTWLRLYALTCKLLVEDLENICVGAAFRYYSVGTRRPDIRDVQYIYENTPAGSGMRRLLRERLTLGMFRGRQNNPVTSEWREVLNETPDLGFDIVSEISGFHWISGGNAPARGGSGECSFHRHEKGEVCRT